MEKTGIGIVGIGFMGMIHYLAARKVAGARIAALCSRDPKKLSGDWTGIQGNFGPRGTRMDLSAHARYASADELLADPAVTLVDLCVPNDEHATLAVKALEAGKHVLVEKPIALTAADADRMVAAAEASGRMLMVAHVLPFFPEFAFAREAVASGRYGPLRAAHFERIISRPDWSSGIADVERSGGPAIDLHIHDTHFIGLLCGVPKAVQSRGFAEGPAVVYLATQYLYDGPDAPTVTANSGALAAAGRPFTHGFSIYLEKATIVLEGGKPLALITAEGATEPKLEGSGDPVDAFAAELAEAVRAVASGTPSAMLSGDLARQALRLCQAEVESVRSGRAVPLD